MDRPIYRPWGLFWDLLGLISGFEGGAALQAVSGCPGTACDKDESGKFLPDQSGTLFIHYCHRLAWKVLARLVW